MEPTDKINTEDLRHFENMQFSLIKFALSVYSILGATVLGLYSTALKMGIQNAIQQSGLNLPLLMNALLWVGATTGGILFLMSLFNFLRLLRARSEVSSKSYRSRWSFWLNIMPVLVLSVIIGACLWFRNSLFT